MKKRVLTLTLALTSLMGAYENDYEDDYRDDSMLQKGAETADLASDLKEERGEQEGPPLLDLEEGRQDFVLETRRLEIPGYPRAFNPSIARWKGAYLLSFRVYQEKGNAAPGVGLVWLDDQLNMLESGPQLLEFPIGEPYLNHKRQDPRLITVGERLYLVYNIVYNRVLPLWVGDGEIRRMVIAEIHTDGHSFWTDQPLCFTQFERENPQRSEKNWVPFAHEGNLLFGYSIVPHRVLYPFPSGSCETIATTGVPLGWQWGILRGGTPALLVDGHYLAFFHSSQNLETLHSKGKTHQHYFMGAYTFEAKPPFALTQISPEPIIGKNFYHGVAYKTWKPLTVVFPGGFVVDDHHVWIAYGRQDHEVWLAKLDKKGLANHLVPVPAL